MSNVAVATVPPNNLPTQPPGAKTETKSHSVTVPVTVFRPKHNYISTTKYTLLTFLPLNLYFQFHRFYNIYFLLGALSVIGGYSSLSPVSVISPLLVVLTFSAVKDAIEDINRYRQDKKANTTPVVVYRSRVRTTILAQDIQPGDILCLQKGEKSFVDGIFITSSYEDGTAFIDTADLDGETNLKRRTAPLATCHLTLEQVLNLKATLQFEEPNDNLHSFQGAMEIDGKPVPLDMSNMILRGAVLRNTEQAYVYVIYTGMNTKIIKNLKSGRVKTSTMERKLNWLIIYAFGYNMILLVSSILLEYKQYVWVLDQEDILRGAGVSNYACMWYIGPANTDRSLHALLTFISFFGIYTYVIPISLFVTLELSRLAQAFYLSKDPKMTFRYKDVSGKIVELPVRTNNSNLNEDLGNINYIFSDKTGTLTQNVMRMGKWYVEGLILDEMKTPVVFSQTITEQKVERDIIKRLITLGLSLSLCHGVIPSIDERSGLMVYESQSPDETALLNACRSNSIELVSRTKSLMKVKVLGEMQEFELLNVIEFTSTRKRMSVIIRKDGIIRLYCKGADNIIIERLGKIEPDVLEHAQKSLTDFSNEGLRTLVVAQRTLTEEEYQAFDTAFNAAAASLDNREDNMAKAAEMVECQLELVGCTAIEDRLQDQVPQTIANLLRAGIKLWLLTGDKLETAINIGMSSQLINKHMKLLIIKGDDVDSVIREMDQHLSDIDTGDKDQQYALVVTGPTLKHILSGPQKSKFLDIGTRCASVICCRVSPLQKALVVRLVRSSVKTAVTLAIGDGANDVSMIQEAHVGVGIMGKEGTQAVRAADYAFGEFRFLYRLLVVHGRFFYLKMANLIFYSMYKNFTFITVQWWFGFFNAWSGQAVYDEIFFVAFNIIYTSLPPFLYSIFERDVRSELLEKNPESYIEIANGFYWNYKVMFRWLLSSLIQSMFVFGTVYFTNITGVVDINGRSTGFYVQTFLFSTPLLITVTFKIASITRHWIWPIWTGMLLSLGVNVAIMFSLGILSSFLYTDSGSSVITHGLPAYYFLCVVMPAICILPDIFADYIMDMFYPSDTSLLLFDSKKYDKKLKFNPLL